MNTAECFQDNILVNYSDYSTIVGYILTAFGVFGSLMIIITKNRYFSKDSEFGYLILSIGILDLLTAFIWLCGAFTNGIMNYQHCIQNSTVSENEYYYSSQGSRISDIFLFASGNLGVAVSFIAYSITCRNGIKHILNWKKLLLISTIISLGLYLAYAVYFDLAFKNAGTDISIYYTVYDIYAIILVVLYLYFYIATHRGLNARKSANSSKLLMLTMLQALTISNLLCWLPLILNYTFTALLIQSIATYNESFFSVILYISSATVYAKGFYHICALYLAELYAEKREPKNASGEDTIKWDFTLSKPERILDLDNTL